MTGLVRKATLLVVGGLTLAGAAIAGLPNAANSTRPARIVLVDGVNPTAVANNPAFYENTFIIRDEENNPVPNAAVVLDFNALPANAYDVALVQPDAGVVVDVSTKTVTKYTDLAGSVTFTLAGTGNGTSLVPNSGGLLADSYRTGNGLLTPPSIPAYAGSVLMGQVEMQLRRYDFDGSGTIGAFDLTLWLDQFFLGLSAANLWGDYQGDVTLPLGAFDLTLWLDAFFLNVDPVTQAEAW